MNILSRLHNAWLDSWREVRTEHEREQKLEMAHAILDAHYARFHYTMPGRLCDPGLCRQVRHPKA